MAEAFGRIQSGGAINKDEEARFKKCLPPTDSKKFKLKKACKYAKGFLDRLDTLGFKPEEVGIQNKSWSYGKNQIRLQRGDTKNIRALHIEW